VGSGTFSFRAVNSVRQPYGAFRPDGLSPTSVHGQKSCSVRVYGFVVSVFSLLTKPGRFFRKPSFAYVLFRAILTSIIRIRPPNRRPYVLIGYFVKPDRRCFVFVSAFRRIVITRNRCAVRTLTTPTVDDLKSVQTRFVGRWFLFFGERSERYFYFRIVHTLPNGVSDVVRCPRTPRRVSGNVPAARARDKI